MSGSQGRRDMKHLGTSDHSHKKTVMNSSTLVFGLLSPLFTGPGNGVPQSEWAFAPQLR